MKIWLNQCFYYITSLKNAKGLILLKAPIPEHSFCTDSQCEYQISTYCQGQPLDTFGKGPIQ